jgi:hypothetical protein
MQPLLWLHRLFGHRLGVLAADAVKVDGLGEAARDRGEHDLLVARGRVDNGL